MVKEVFIVMFNGQVLNAYSSQYLADTEVARLNKEAMENNLPERAYAICRHFYTF